MEQRGIALVRIKKIFTSPLFLLRICMGMRIDSSGNVRIDHQQTTKKKRDNLATIPFQLKSFGGVYKNE